MPEQQINLIKKYFHMWITKDYLDLSTIFTNDINYLECYGAQYVGLAELEQWITHKFEVQTVHTWDIKAIYQQADISTVEWSFSCTDHNQEFEFDGVSIIRFKENLIAEVKEFESKSKHYRPYQK